MKDTSSTTVLQAREITRVFPGSPPQSVLAGINLEAKRGETVAIMGGSGEGKSTLLHILGTLDLATSGQLFLCGKAVTPRSAASLRNQEIGFVFQSFHLLEEFSVLDNILLPQRIGRKGSDPTWAKTLLREVGLEGKEGQLAKTLSGGEKQRVAIARAFINRPSLLLADEPTGNLDKTHSLAVQTLLIEKAKAFGGTLIAVTHDAEFAKRCDRLLFLKKGHLYTQPQ